MPVAWVFLFHANFESMWHHQNLSDKELYGLIRAGKIGLGGNKRLKIYGTLHCSSGKRMKRESRVFFEAEMEAQKAGYRPCKRCLFKQ